MDRYQPRPGAWVPLPPSQTRPAFELPVPSGPQLQAVPGSQPPSWDRLTSQPPINVSPQGGPPRWEMGGEAGPLQTEGTDQNAPAVASQVGGKKMGWKMNTTSWVLLGVVIILVIILLIIGVAYVYNRHKPPPPIQRRGLPPSLQQISDPYDASRQQMSGPEGDTQGMVSGYGTEYKYIPPTGSNSQWEAVEPEQRRGLGKPSVLVPHGESPGAGPATQQRSHSSLTEFISRTPIEEEEETEMVTKRKSLGNRLVESRGGKSSTYSPGRVAEGRFTAGRPVSTPHNVRYTPPPGTERSPMIMAASSQLLNGMQ